MILNGLFRGGTVADYTYAANFVSSFPSDFTFTRNSSATYFDANSVIQTASTDVPRIDHDPATGAPLGFLSEEARTNSWLNCEDLTTGTASGASVTANAAVSPADTTTMDKLTEDSSTGEHKVTTAITVTATNVKLPITRFIKASGRTKVRITLQDGTTTADSAYVNVTLSGAGTVDSTGVTGTGTAYFSEIVRIGSTDVYRVRFVCKPTTTTSTSVNIIENILDSGGNTSYTGDGTSGIFLWGGMLEQNKDAPSVSYISSGATATTRQGDVAKLTDITGFFNSSQGTLVCKASIPYAEWYVSNTFNYFVSLLNSVNGGHRYTIMHRAIATGHQLLVRAAAVNEAVWNTISDLSNGTMSIKAVAYKLNDCNSAVDGVVNTADTVATLATGIDELHVGSGYGAVQINGHTQYVHYYNTRLSDAKLGTVTG